MNYSELIESFTSDVIKKTKETTIEDKRKNILSLYDITKYTIEHLIEKDGTLENAGQEFYDNALPKENTYGKEIRYENSDKEEVCYSFVLWKANTRVPSSYTLYVPLYYTLYIALNKGENLCYVNFQKVFNNQFGIDALEYAILEPDKRGGGKYQYPLIKEYSDIIIKFVKIYLKYRKRFLGLKVFDVGLIKNVFNGDLNESFTSKVIKDAKEKTIEDKRNDLFDFVDLGLPSGNMWCKYNYGADNEYEDGEYINYKDAIKIEYHEGELPSRDDFVELYNNCKFEWIEGIDGVLFTSKTNGRTIFFPAAGQIISNDNLLNKNKEGHYWSSTEYPSNSVYNKNNSYEMLIHNDKHAGYHVRPQYYNHQLIKNSIRLVLKKKSIKESFTNNVIKNVKNTTQEKKRQDILQIQFEDPEVERICHEHGVYTYDDVKQVTSIKGWFDRSNIMTFNEFRYFTKLTSIESGAFQYCRYLQSINIPSSVTSIEGGAFQHCRHLQSINIPSSVTSIEGGAFLWCESLQSVNIPDSVTRIRNYAFEGCKALQSITIPNSVTSIGDFAFWSCESLQSVNIPDSLQELVGYLKDLFYECTSLKIIYISKNNKFIKRFKAFAKKNNIQILDPSLKESFTTGVINKAKSKTQEEKREELSYIKFEDPEVERICHKCGVYTINDARQVTSIKGWFYNNVKIQSFNEFKHFTRLEEIEEYAFYWCENLKSIIMPNSVTIIENSAFYYCKSLQSINIPDSVTSIGDNTFEGCESLIYVNIPNSVTSIGNGAFRECVSLQSINIPDGVTSIGNGVFQDCKSLQSIYISKNCPVYDKIKDEYPDIQLVEPGVSESFTTGVINKAKSKTQEEKRAEIVQIQFEDPEVERICHEHGVYTVADARKVTSIKKWFEENLMISSFKELEFFTGLKTLDVRSFHYCERLKEIILPESIETIGPKAFTGCHSLISIVIPGNVISIDESCFFGCTALRSIEIPESVTSIERFCFMRCSSLRSIVIPSGVTTIESHTFAGCETLVSVTLPETLESIGREAFYECINLKSIHIPDNIKTIQNRSTTSTSPSLFDRCHSLEKIYISRKSPVRGAIEKAYPGVELIDPSEMNESFTSNVIKKTKESTQEEKREIVSEICFKDKILEKFFHKRNIYTISDAAKVEDYDLKRMLFAAIHYNNFDKIQYFNEFKYFKKVTTIPENAFSYTDLKEITFPDSIKMISDSAFKESKIEKVIFSKNLEYMNADVFRKTLCLKEIDLRNTKIRTIPYGCFYGSSIERIYLPETLEVIGQYAFAVSELKEIILHPNCKLNIIQSHAFDGCQISKFDFKEGLIEIGNNAFDSCLLRTISFPSTLQRIGCNCFEDNSNLINVEFPENSELRVISSNAFRRTKLSKFVLPKNLRYIDNPFCGELSNALTIYYHPSQIEMINYLKRVYNVSNYFFTEIKDNINESFTSNVIKKTKEEKEQIDNHDGLYILAEISEENILKLYEEWCDNTTFRDPVHADEQDEFCKIMPYTIKYKFKKGKPTMEERIARSFKQFIFEKTNGNLVFRYSPEWGQEKLQCIEFFDFTETKNMRSMKNSIGYSHDKEHPSYFYGTEYIERFIKYKKNENLIKDWYIPVFVSIMKEDKKGLCKKFEKYFI